MGCGRVWECESGAASRSGTSSESDSGSSSDRYRTTRSVSVRTVRV
jgi:hypothetical protein